VAPSDSRARLNRFAYRISCVSCIQALKMVIVGATIRYHLGSEMKLPGLSFLLLTRNFLRAPLSCCVAGTMFSDVAALTRLRMGMRGTR
jgi:hypothetical protein